MIFGDIMEKVKTFTLPKLPYDYNALAPYISEEQLKLHHDKHHQKYVNDANALFVKIDESRAANTILDVKAVTKELAFNIGGHMLHSIFWENMAPASISRSMAGFPAASATKTWMSFRVTVTWCRIGA